MEEVHLSDYTKRMEIYSQKMDALRYSHSNSNNRNGPATIGITVVIPNL